jgi:hypothetical protein
MNEEKKSIYHTQQPKVKQQYLKNYLSIVILWSGPATPARFYAMKHEFISVLLQW